MLPVCHIRSIHRISRLFYSGNVSFYDKNESESLHYIFIFHICNNKYRILWQRHQNERVDDVSTGLLADSFSRVVILVRLRLLVVLALFHLHVTMSNEICYTTFVINVILNF